MAPSGDPTKRPLPLEFHHEFEQQNSRGWPGGTESTTAANEARPRRHERSLTLTSPAFPKYDWNQPADPGAPGRHRRRLSDGFGKLLRSVQALPLEAEETEDSFGVGRYTKIPELSERNFRDAKPKPTVPLTEPSVFGKIELRNELRAGKIPSSSDINEPIIIHREDLREKCREVARERDAESEKRVKAMNTSSKSLISGLKNAVSKMKKEPTPAMTNKAAEVFGISPRKMRKYEAKPIRPSKVIEPPPKYLQQKYSDLATAPLLPGRGFGREGIGHSHYDDMGRQEHPELASSAGRTSQVSKGKMIDNNVDATEKEPSFSTPPTPPAKDTPRRLKHFGLLESPLRRMSQARDLHFSFESSKQPVAQQPLEVPKHLPILKSEQEATDANGPVKNGSYNASELTALIEGRATEWPLSNYPQARELSEVSEPTSTKTRFDRDSELALQPRFYSPANHSERSFAPGESPSKNTDPTRMLFRHPSRAHTPKLSDESSGSKDGTIGVMFQGNPEDIDRGSSTYQMLSEREQDMAAAPAAARDNTIITSRVLQELRLSDHEQSDTPSSHAVFDKPSLRLTEMLHEADPRMHSWDRSFQPNCPSAVPSPLHHMSKPATPHAGHSAMVSPNQAPPLDLQTPKSLDEHFWMTNEHLDVVGKTTWDILSMSTQETLAALNSKHAKLMTLLEKHFEDVKSHLANVNEKAGHCAEKIANVHHDIDNLLSLYKSEMMGAFAAQDKKTVQMEGQLKDLQASMQTIQKLLEQKDNEVKSNQQPLANYPHNTPGCAQSPYAQPIHRSQPSLGGYYGHHSNTTREVQHQIPQMHDNMNAASPQDSGDAAQTGYDTSYGQQWTPRVDYPIRGSSREARPPFSSTNPYQYSVNGGPFNSGYTGVRARPSRACLIDYNHWP
ncbi:hypothetical protein J1614_008402 [Plenodomus biglobosus]|nr:hypothetical protein J1614_008402 [Plenodomus biglobosus]